MFHNLNPLAGRSKRLQVWVLFFAAVSIWGTSFILVKKGLFVYSPIQVGTLRMFIAGMVLSPFAISYLWRNRLKYPWGLLLIASLTGNLLPAMLFPWAQTRLESALTGALNALTPLFTLLIGALFFRTRFSSLQALGIGLGLLGALILILGRAGGISTTGIMHAAYGLIVVACTLLYAFNVNFVKTRLAHLHAVELTSLLLGLAAIPSGIVLFSTGFVTTLITQPGAVQAALYVTVLGAVGSALALLLFYKLIQLSSALFAASNTYFIPFVALLWGLADGEAIGGFHILGMGIILLGVYLMSRFKPTPKTAPIQVTSTIPK